MMKEDKNIGKFVLYYILFIYLCHLLFILKFFFENETRVETAHHVKSFLHWLFNFFSFIWDIPCKDVVKMIYLNWRLETIQNS